MTELNATHDPKLKSFVASANAPDTQFPIQNLPLGIFSKGKTGKPHGGVAIGDQVLDLSLVLKQGLFSGAAKKAAEAAAGPTLNPLMAMGNAAASALRKRLSELLREGSKDMVKVKKALVPMKDVTLHKPAQTTQFIDFMTSSYHVSRGRQLLNPDQPIPPAFKYLPIAYNSRATLRVSGEEIRRPNGQWQLPDGKVHFGPTEQFDFELEFGFFVGPGNKLGEPIHIDDASSHMFGFVLVNDWSIRDVQRWESILGPFLAKSLSTSISPWVVTSEALEPFKTAAFARPDGDPQPLPYLASPKTTKEGGYDVDMEVWLQSEQMRKKKLPPVQIVKTNLKHLYWTLSQMLTHSASNGCNMQTGDLIASGTVSGPTDDSRACLAEKSVRGTQPFDLPSGEKRTFLEDGDDLIFRAYARREGRVTIGFGECSGRIAPAVKWPKASAKTKAA